MEKILEFHEMLYVSTLAPDAPVEVVSEIAAQARKANEALGITGLLIFDGMRFCQQIEGKRKQVLSLTERIQQDSRHINVEILHHGPLATRRFKRFSLGYAGAEDVDVLARMEQASPEQAIAQFLALVPTLDMYG